MNWKIRNGSDFELTHLQVVRFLIEIPSTSCFVFETFMIYKMFYTLRHCGLVVKNFVGLTKLLVMLVYRKE